MDPITVASTAGTCAKVVGLAWSLGETLYAFIKETRTVNQAVKALADQAKQLSSTCELVEDFLLDKRHELEAKISGKDSDQIWKLKRCFRSLNDQVEVCYASIESPGKLSNGLRDDNGKFVKKAVTQFKLNMKKEQMSAMRISVNTSMSALETSMYVLSQ